MQGSFRGFWISKTVGSYLFCTDIFFLNCSDDLVKILKHNHCTSRVSKLSSAVYIPKDFTKQNSQENPVTCNFVVLASDSSSVFPIEVIIVALHCIDVA